MSSSECTSSRLCSGVSSRWASIASIQVGPLIQGISTAYTRSGCSWSSSPLRCGASTARRQTARPGKLANVARWSDRLTRPGTR